jgi:hypothetical protein
MFVLLTSNWFLQKHSPRNSLLPLNDLRIETRQVPLVPRVNLLPQKTRQHAVSGTCNAWPIVNAGEISNWIAIALVRIATPGRSVLTKQI